MSNVRLSPEQSQILLDLARRAIHSTLAGKSFLPDAPDDPALLDPAGCFVSLHDRAEHRLRGCIGRLDHTPLWRAVISSAADVLDDPRFITHPVTSAELALLEIEISVLSALRPVPAPLDFDPENEGIHLSIEGRSGLFLPQVARETGWTREQLLERLCTEKMALSPRAWKSPDAHLQVFTTQVIGPVPFEPVAVQ